MRTTLLFFTLFVTGTLVAQQPQGFFLDDWQPKTTVAPDYKDTMQTTTAVNVSVKINFNDTITKVPKYVYGDNFNPYTGWMSNDPALMKHIINRNMGVIRSPGGSLSDVYFWNRYASQPPTDVPARLAGSTDIFTPWYGKRTQADNWATDIDSFYRVIKLANYTAIQTVNYGYARYGTSANPVAQAAHMAADWVRYDNGRSKFWEIGNEVFGSWEAGYRIDPIANKDGQPEYITPDLYGQHCLVFMDSMRHAAQQIGKTIKIGVVAVESTSTSAEWNYWLFQRVGDKADFYVIHSYYTPYNQNSTVNTILNSAPLTGTYVNYIKNLLTALGKPQKPIALDEWNIFAIGSKQQVSNINGIQASMMLGQIIKQKIGLACRWDLANDWSNGDDHGLFSSGNEPGVPKYNPRPAFYYMYYFQKFFGDVMVNSTVVGDTNIVVYPSLFNSGQAAAVVVNKGRFRQTVRVNLQNFKSGSRYYAYTLNGGTDNGDFSLKTYVNGYAPTYVNGGPVNYEQIKARSSVIDNEIRISCPALSVTYLMVDPGQTQLAINETVTPNATPTLISGNEVIIFPNPAKDKIEIKNLEEGYYTIDIQNLQGKIVFSSNIKGNNGPQVVNLSLLPGFYIVTLNGEGKKITRKLIVE